VAVAVIAGSVWLASSNQRSAAERVFDESVAGQHMLTAMLNQETGLRGFALTGRDSFLIPYERGRRDFDLAVADARSISEDDGRTYDSTNRQAVIARDWQKLADEQIGMVRAQAPDALAVHGFLRRKRLFDDFRRENQAFQAEVAESRARTLQRAQVVPVTIIIALALLFGGIGYVLIDRSSRLVRERRQRDATFRSSQGEFVETLQAMRNEVEAHALVKEHLERTLPDAEVTVLNRNHSDDRLEPATRVPLQSALAERLLDASPDSCVAVRLARQHEQGAGCDPLMRCNLCGADPGRRTTCTPSLVSGEVIGSVLVDTGGSLDDEERKRVQESVTQSAPVLANLRNLAVAESRAATDALTGLPNNRAVRDTLKRLGAQAQRDGRPLAAVLLDLDHFKQINDVFGHACGDDVLAAVGAVLSSRLRDGDFAGRYGGEEFLVLLPGADRAAAVTVAEALRHELERIKVAGVTRSITGSFGVAVMPEDGVDAEQLVRQADHALYAAKGAGRNRVHVAERESARKDDEADGTATSGGSANRNGDAQSDAADDRPPRASA
jgi:diguanylate cyclase (GGDEF)-like protein